MSEEQKQENEQTREDVGASSGTGSKKRIIAAGVIVLLILIGLGFALYLNSSFYDELSGETGVRPKLQLDQMNFG